MATKFKLKIRNPELRLQIEQITGAINALEDGGSDLDGRVTALEEAGVVVLAGTPTTPSAQNEATGNLKISAIPKEDEHILIKHGDVQEKVTFVAIPGDWDDEGGSNPWAPEEDEIDIDQTPTEIQDAVKAWFAGSTLVTVGDWAVNELELTAILEGVAGNAIETTTSLTEAGDGFTKATLTGGADAVIGVVGAKGQLMFDATHIYISVDESTETESKWKGVAFT